MVRIKGSYHESISILGLSKGASEDAIKDAYRKLAKQYHPDVNPSDKGVRFREINRAYRYLKKHPNPPVEVQYQTRPSPSATDFEEKRRAYHRRKKAEKAQEKVQKAAMFAWLFSNLRLFVLVVLIFNMLLAIDYLLPTVPEEVQITAIKRIKMPRKAGHSDRDYTYKATTSDGGEFRIKASEVSQIDRDSPHILRVTPLIREGVRLTAKDNDSIILYQEFGVYRIFGVFIPISIGFILAYFYWVKNNDYRLTLLLIVFTIFILQLVLIF